MFIFLDVFETSGDEFIEANAEEVGEFLGFIEVELLLFAGFDGCVGGARYADGKGYLFLGEASFDAEKLELFDGFGGHIINSISK